MTCKRCGYTHDPSGQSQEPTRTWSLPDLCSPCVTADEARLERQYQGLIDGLREELQQDRFERYLLAIAQGLASDPTIVITNDESVRRFVLRAFTLATALSEAAEPETEPEDDADTDPARRLVTP